MHFARREIVFENVSKTQRPAIVNKTKPYRTVTQVGPAAEVRLAWLTSDSGQTSHSSLTFPVRRWDSMTRWTLFNCGPNYRLRGAGAFESISRGVLICQDVRLINQSNRSDHS